MRQKEVLCFFTTIMGILVQIIPNWKWEIESLIKKIYLKEFIPSEKSKKSEYQGESPRRKFEEWTKYDGEVPVIYGGSASRGDTMAAWKNYIKKAKVVAIKVTNIKSS